MSFDDKTPLDYEVLYFRRTNKVHKSKGVTKTDGILTVHPSNGTVCLKAAASDDDDDDDDKESSEEEEEPTTWKKKKRKNQMKMKQPPKRDTIFSGIQRDLSKRLLQPDDVVSLGFYEVQILCCRNENEQQTSVGKTTSTINKTTLKTMMSIRGSSSSSSSFPRQQPPRKAMTVVKRRKMAVPLQSKVNAKAAARNNSTMATTTTLKHSSSNSSILNTTASRAPIMQQQQQQQQAVVTRPPKLLPQKRPLSLSLSSITTKKSTAVASLLARKKPSAVQKVSTSSVQKNRISTSNHSIRRPSPPAQPLKRQRQLISSTTTSTTTTTSTMSQLLLSHIPLPATLSTKLKPHQVTGIHFLWNALHSLKGNGNGNGGGAILADEMGLGKSCMTVAILAAWHRRHREKQFVVVCPSSLVSNWASEFDKWVGPASEPKRVVITKGGAQGLAQIRGYCAGMKQQQLLSKKKTMTGQVLIISYDLFRMNVAQFQDIPQTFGLLVVDEGHRLKNTAGSLTLTALESLSSDARLCLTATPIQNKLSEFFNLANFVRPGVLGDLQSFRRDYERPIAAANHKNASQQDRARGLAQSQALEQITKTFMIRRLQKDVLKTMLPPRTEALLFCRPSENQCQLYRDITKRVSTQEDAAAAVTASGSMAEALSALTALRKVCAHPFLYQEEETTNVDDAVSLSGKLVVLDALLRSIRDNAPNDKIVVVSNFTSALDMIESLVLQPRQLSYSRLDGTTELSNRKTLVDSFNRSSPETNFCFLLSSKAGGCGLNLVGANRLVMFDGDFNPALDVQAMGRVYRQGQTKSTMIYRLVTAGTIEEVIYQRQWQKGNLATLAVDNNNKSNNNNEKAWTGRFTKEELADCFHLKEKCTCDTKLKVGTHWTTYDGPDSLQLQGCFDVPLLDVADTKSAILGYVHIADDKEDEMPNDLASTANDSASPTEEQSLYDSDEEEEFEF